MKKLIASGLALVMALSLAACSGGDDPSATTPQSTTPDTTTSAPDTTFAPDTTPETDPTSVPDTTPVTEQVTSPSGEILEGPLQDILAKIYETAEVNNDMRTWLNDRTVTTEVPVDNTSYYFGIENLEFEEAIASEPLMRPGAYSLCLLRAKEGTDIEQLKADIAANVNPAKWVCAGVDPENVIVDNIGNLVILIMSDDFPEELHSAFLALQ